MRTLIRVFIRLYQLTLSPLLVAVGGPGSGCRFHPSCSNYFLQAIELHGLQRGTFLGLKRIARCHPWGGSGEDAVPPKTGDLAGRPMSSSSDRTGIWQRQTKRCV